MPIVSIVALESNHLLVVPIVSIVNCVGALTYTIPVLSIHFHPIANLDVLASISSYHPVLIRNGNTCPMTASAPHVTSQPSQ